LNRQGTYRELSDRQFEKWLEEGGDPSSFIKTRNRKKNSNKRRDVDHDEDDAESDPSDGSGDEAQQSQEDEEAEELAENDDEVVPFGRRRTRSAVKASAPRPTRQSRRASASSPALKRRRVEISDDEPDDEDIEAALAAEFE
jgi:hypothetical protein